MVTKRFSGNSNYELDVTPSLSGRNGSLLVRVRKITGFGYWVASPGPGYSGSIDGTGFSGTWTYDYQTGPTVQTVTSRSKSSMAPGSRSWSVTVNMASGIGSATLSGTFSVPPDAPAAPSIGTPARVSDSTQTVNWVRNASVAAPYTSQQLQRSVFTGSWGEWAAIATLGTDYTTSGSMSQSDKGTVANRVYRYRVKASNSRSSATSGVSQSVYTTPGAPSQVAAVKTTAGGVKITLTQTVVHDNFATDIEYSINGGSSWTDLTTLGSSALSYTWASPPAGETVKFRARVRNNTSMVGNGLASSWRESNSVPLAAPPAAPSQLTPNGVAFDADTEDQVFTWLHNSQDTSEQEAYELQYRPVGGSWTSTGEVASGVSGATFPAGTFVNDTAYEWQVRTWGIHETASPWSATATFECSAPPSAAVVSPSGTLAASIVTVSWTYFDEEASLQSAWEAQLLLGGQVVEALSGPGAATSATFTTALTDATEYQVSVRVRDGAGLWSAWDTATFTTDFPAPPAPEISLTWDAEQGAVVVEIVNPEPGVGQVAAVSNTILRSTDGETWDTSVVGAGVNTATADPTTPIGVPVMFKAIAWSDLPSSAEGEPVTITPSPDYGFWSGGEGFNTSVAMEFGSGGAPRVDFTAGLHEKVLHYFAGRTYPVETSGVARNRTGSVSFLITTPEQLEAVKALAYLPAPHLIRIPDGEVVFCSISDVSYPREFINLHAVSFTATEVAP